jgi:tetratricopeptide (TPR) repeat protein
VKLVLENRSYLARCVVEKEFIPHISACFKEMGMVREELELFSSMADTAWVGANQPFLYFRIHEDAWTLGEFAMAEASGKLYLERFSADGKAEKVREQVGSIQYRHGDMSSVASTLFPLLKAKTKATNPVSYYYLGKACEKLLDLKRAGTAMALYLRSQPHGTDTALTADARIVLASAQLSRKETTGALETYRAGYEGSRGENRDMFLYKMGETFLTLKNAAEARIRWEQLVREGKDPVWKSLAIQALADLSWREEWKQ